MTRRRVALAGAGLALVPISAFGLFLVLIDWPQTPDAFDPVSDKVGGTPDSWHQALTLAGGCVGGTAIVAGLWGTLAWFAFGRPRPGPVALAVLIAPLVVAAVIGIGWTQGTARPRLECGDLPEGRLALDVRQAEALPRCGALLGQDQAAVVRRLGPPATRVPPSPATAGETSWAYAAGHVPPEGTLAVRFEGGRVTGAEFDIGAVPGG